MLAVAIAMSFNVALFLTAVGILRRSSAELIVAAVLSFAFGAVLYFSIATIGFALFAVDLAAIIAVRLGARWRGWIVAMVGATVVSIFPAVLVRVAPHADLTRILYVVIPFFGLTLAVHLLIRGASSEPAT